MKKKMKLTIFMILSLLLTLSGLSFAMHHNSGHGSHVAVTSEHNTPQMKTRESGHGGGHMGMEMSADMMMLGTEIQAGVKAMAHISDTSAAMAAAGMKQTHHLMVAFADAATMAAIASGRVAVRVVTPAGRTLPAIPLQGMDGAFGGDVELREKGIYTLQVGSQLHDNEARQFSFQYEVK